jgi:hypothetical protein
MSDLPDGIDRLTERLQGLEQRLVSMERRLDALEHPLAARWPPPSPQTETTPAPTSAAPIVQSGSMFSVLGKAMLGIAGAYVLRALAESSSLPRLAVASAGIAYAFLWLVWAARVRGGPGSENRYASSIYAATSALILAPMLWELTLRFKVLPAAIAAGVVLGYALAALALAAFARGGSHRELAPGAAPPLRVAFVAAAGLSLALAMASHAILPFIVVLLILTAFCEFAPGLDRMPEIGALMALSADAATWILIYVNFSPQSESGDHPLARAALLAPGIALLLLFIASVAFRTVLGGKQITVFATFQTTIALLLAAVSLADFGQPFGIVIFGALCLVLSAACCAAVFTVFERAPERRNSVTDAARRNSVVFAAWAAALLLAGSFLCLPPLPAIMLLGAAAVAATLAGSRKKSLAFEFYGTVFLLAAASASGLFSFLAGALVVTPTGTPPLGVWLIMVCAILCYAAAMPREGEGWKPQTLRLAFAALATAAVAALVVQGLVLLVALKVVPGAHHLAFIRTLTLCIAALSLVYAGAHWRRVELTRVGYAALAMVAVKLVIEDLRHGHLAYIAASIFLVALTLIAAPRVARVRLKA